MYSVRGAKQVTVQRKKRGLGFSVKGGKEHGIPILVSSIETDCASGSALLQTRVYITVKSSSLPAYELRLGDEILAVNGESLQVATHSEAVQKLKSAGHVVTLLIRSNQTLEGTLFCGQFVSAAHFRNYLAQTSFLLVNPLNSNKKKVLI